MKKWMKKQGTWKKYEEDRKFEQQRNKELLDLNENEKKEEKK